MDIARETKLCNTSPLTCSAWCVLRTWHVDWGGDEFAVILSRANPRDAIRRVNEWRNFLKEHPLDLESGGSVTIRFSAGVASYPLHATSMDEVSSYADVALYRAKARGRNCTIEYA